MFVFKGVPGFFVKSFLYFFAKHINIGFINFLAFIYQLDSVVNFDIS